MGIKISLLIVFFAVMIGIGIYCRKHATNVGGFVLGGRNVGPWLSAFAYGTSYFSAVVFIGYAGQFGASYGISATWIGIGNALIGSMLAWLVLGNRTRIMTKHFNASTMPEFFEKRYDSKSLKIVASVIIFVFLVPYTASIYKGLSGLFEMAFGIDFVYCLIVMAVITAVYVIVGGYMATAINDFIQGIIMLAGIIAVIVFVLQSKGGLISSLELLSKEAVSGGAGAGMQSPYTSLFGPDPIGLLGVVVLTSLGTWGLPQMIHKFYTIKDKKAIKTGTIISTVFAIIISGGAYFLGAFGRLFVPEQMIKDGKFDQIIPEMLKILPDLLLGIVIVLVLSASMSTLSSLVITSSSTFTLDFLKGSFFRNMKEKTKMIIIKLLCAAFIVISVVIALNKSNLITALMSVSWGALSGAFLAPFLYGLFWKGITRGGVWAGFITGIGITVLNIFLNLVSPPMAGALAMVASLIVVPVVSLVTPKLSKEVVNYSFECYDKE